MPAWAGPQRFADAALSLVNDVRLIRGIPDATIFEAPNLDNRRPIAVFQTRVWEPEPSAENFEALNEQRVQLVRALKERLGPRFVGGIVPDDYSRRAYPDLLATQDTRRRDYARLLSTASIGVYSRGVHGSVAGKLPEYLAAGLAVVSDSMTHRLGDALTAGTHFVQYDTADECANTCGLYLSDPSRLREMQISNLSFYQQHVRPVAHVRSLLLGIGKFVSFPVKATVHN